MTNSRLSHAQCRVMECDNRAHATGLCSAHYARFRRNGTFESVRSVAPLMQCVADGCHNSGRYPTTGPLCGKHTYRMKRWGSLDMPKRTLASAYWGSVPKDQPIHECWEWQGTRTIYGYGQMCVRGKVYRAHRVAFFLHYKYWPDEVVMHECDNKICVNPRHLRAGSFVENSHQAWERGLYARGEAQGNAKLTEPQVHHILTSEDSVQSLAMAYGVTSACISAVRTRKNWRHVC